MRGLGLWSKNMIAPFCDFVSANWLHHPILSLLSFAYFWGLKTDPDALALCRVSYTSGAVKSVVAIDVVPLPVTCIAASCLIVPIGNGSHCWKFQSNVFQLVRCLFAPMSLCDSSVLMRTHMNTWVLSF